MGCNDPIPGALRPEDLARIEALERRIDAFEARIARELAELKDWMNAQFQELARRIEAQGAQQARMQADLDALRAQLQRVESELRTRTATASAHAPDALSMQDRPIAQDNALAVDEAVAAVPPDGAPEEEIQGPGESEAADVGDDGAGIKSRETSPAEQASEPEAPDVGGTAGAGVHEAAPAEAAPAEAEKQEQASEPELASTKSTQSAPIDEIWTADPEREAASPREGEPSVTEQVSERIAAAELRMEAKESRALQAVGELRSNLVQQMSQLFEKFGKDDGK